MFNYHIDDSTITITSETAIPLKYTLSFSGDIKHYAADEIDEAIVTEAEGDHLIVGEKCQIVIFSDAIRVIPENRGFILFMLVNQPTTGGIVGRE